MTESAQPTESSDLAVLDLLRRTDAVTVGELSAAMDVTATAVRQRLNRLMGQGLIQRSARRAGRGRPSHWYELTEKGRRQSGNNFVDLAIALWEEVRAIKHVDIRQGLMKRLAQTLADHYKKQIHGDNAAERMLEIEQLFADRNVPFSVDHSNDLPVLTAHACPYPELAEQDRSICNLEKLLFSNLLQQDVRLTDCRLDGDSCCTFEMNPA
ncbi:MAG: MarR family transcriptional regulator [Planctomycetales bacterium]